jgi:L-fucose isomerase-like protein
MHSPYRFPEVHTAPAPNVNEIVMIASGDLRLSANQVCWPAQKAMESRLTKAIEESGFSVRRGHPFDEDKDHGFIDSQRMGIEVFRNIHPDSPLVVAEAVWQYSHHVLAGLRTHTGPILTIANWDGRWPGLVGMLNLNASLTKAGVEYSTLWSESFDDEFFTNGLRTWLETGRYVHARDHVRDLDPGALPAEEAELGAALAHQLRTDKSVLGVFDEGCMGMYNAIIDDELLNPIGIYKERLSQSALLAEMALVPDDEAGAARDWLEARGMRFNTGSDHATELTDEQITAQLKMYVAAVRIADRFGCDIIGIQYQQGLKDMAPASDLAEGILNNADRPPVLDPATGRELYPGQPLPHFNEVDEGAGVDALVTNRVLTAMGLDPATTLHDVRWGAPAIVDGKEEYVWVLLISGSVPPSHNIGGYAGTVSERQPPMYFPLGGGTVKGVSRPGEIVWSRVYIENAKLHVDLGRATVVELADEETERRWRATTPQWPIMHAVLHGVDRDQFMAQHKANHLNVAYGDGSISADRVLATKAAVFADLGLEVHICGDVTGL